MTHSQLSDVLKLGEKITLLPLINGSGDFAVEVRRIMLNHQFDCLAVPLPASFQSAVESAIDTLPRISVVMQEETINSYNTEWSPGEWEAEDAIDDQRTFSYVPIDPCQGVIAALRIAMQEHMPRRFIDLETRHYEPVAITLPDPYALKKVTADHFAASVLPALPRLPSGQPQDRVVHLAHRLRELEAQFESILLVCALTDWPWIREAYFDEAADLATGDEVQEVETYQVEPATLIFMLGELPYITGLYERARMELDDDRYLAIDGVKDLLLTSRDRYQQEFGQRARKISPKLLKTYLKYVRNLSLIERRMTPDLYTLVHAAQQIAGDQFAIKLAETAREYAFVPAGESPATIVTFGIDQLRLPDGELVDIKSRLPGQPLHWRTCSLNRKPLREDQVKWQMRWNPYMQCSWPPEDIAIERFRTHVKDTALNFIGHDLARSEKFTTSLKDGLDIRETLRNWHSGDLYVKVLPPTRGDLDCVLMLFDSPADPRDYPSRITWHAEHHDESTLSFFATNFHDDMVGPGIGMATYGGALFLFPPRPIPNVWRDPRFDFCDTLEERLLAAGCYHSHEKHIALLSHAPPGVGWRRLARRYNKKVVHVPLSRFSQETIQQLRMFHVLNGQHVRSYAAHFIRKA